MNTLRARAARKKAVAVMKDRALYRLVLIGEIDSVGFLNRTMHVKSGYEWMIRVRIPLLREAEREGGL